MTHPFPRMVVALLFVALTLTAPSFGVAQTVAGVSPSRLQITAPTQCPTLLSGIRTEESGGQWLIGRRINLYSGPNASTALQPLDNQFTQVACYSRAMAAGIDRTFVATRGGETCGWVDTADLLDLHAIGEAGQGRSSSVVCNVPRAMTLKDFCSVLETARIETLDCAGVPRGLRTKGVLIGSTDATDGLPRFPFMSAPVGGEVLGSVLFFSVVEVHDVVVNSPTEIMVLVGDGEGDMFGWIDLRAMSLWPTRLGLFYAGDGSGGMFQREANMYSHILSGGVPSPDIVPGEPAAEIAEFVHGPLPLLSYPIIRVRDSALDRRINQNVPAYHEVIFLGQTGEGAVTDLIAEADVSSAIRDLQRVNLMFVMDTTESMRDYLPVVRDGVANFIRQYRSRMQDPTNRLPDIRIGTYAYSDFLNERQMGIDGPIDLAVLMPPTGIAPGFNVEGPLNGITEHTGLNDVVGLREESAMEAVYQLSARFGTDSGWFENAPRVIIHLADHGSRAEVDMASIRARLRSEQVYYIPLILLTDDQGDANRTNARRLLRAQSNILFADIVRDGDTEGVIAPIDIRSETGRSAERITEVLRVVADEFVQVVDRIRGGVVGRPGRDAASEASTNIASSRIIIDENVPISGGVNSSRAQVIAQASSGFAPTVLIENGLEQTIDWTYTVALEPDQSLRVRSQFSQMCELVGKPDRGDDFRNLLVGLAAAFSGDTIESDQQVTAVLADMRQLPGARDSMMGRSTQQLLQMFDSSDPQIVETLRQEVCWTSYHLNNVEAHQYARPEQLVWTGQQFALRSGEETSSRTYLYSPIVGADTVYLPAYFFVLPQVMEARELEAGRSCIFC